MSLFRTKPLSTLLAQLEETGGLKRTLRWPGLIALGIGAIIGAGLFARTPAAAAQNAGPGVTLSFVIAAIGCAFAGLCYAEFAAMIPDCRQRLYLRIRDHGRTGGMDHWLGVDPGVRAGRGNALHLLDRVLQQSISRISSHGPGGTRRCRPGRAAFTASSMRRRW